MFADFAIIDFHPCYPVLFLIIDYLVKSMHERREFILMEKKNNDGKKAMGEVIKKFIYWKYLQNLIFFSL